MSASPVHVMLVVLLLAVDVLFCLLVGAAAGLPARIDGATYGQALVRAAVAFAGCAALSLALMTFVITAL